MLTLRRCSVCGKRKSSKQFYKSRGYAYSYCKDCFKERVNEDKRFRKYGVTPEKFQQMLAEQHYACKVCEKPFREGRWACAVDHSHETQIVRGILCFRCNMIAGILEKEPDLLDKIRRYIQKVL